MDVIRRNVEQLLNLSKENEKDREPEFSATVALQGWARRRLCDKI